MTETILSSQTATCPQCGAAAIEPICDRACKLAPGRSQEEIMAVCIHTDLMKSVSEKDPCDDCENWIMLESDPGTFVAQETDADGTTVNVHRCRQCNALFKFRAF